MSPDFKTFFGGGASKNLDSNVNLLKDTVEAICLSHCYLLYLLLCMYLAAVVVYRSLFIFMLLLLY